MTNEENKRVFGMQIRTTRVYPTDVVGIDNGRYVTLFWQGTEAAQVYLSQMAGVPPVIRVLPHSQQKGGEE